MLVTDSTAHLGTLAAELDVTVVPLHVTPPAPSARNDLTGAA